MIPDVEITASRTIEAAGRMGPAAGDLSPIALFGDLALHRSRFTLRMADGSRLPEFLGSTARGVLGWELQRLVCPFPKRPPCKTCVVNSHCPYSNLIEGKADLPGFADSPRGYIIEAEKDGHHQARIGLTLLGDCTGYFPTVAAALMNGGARGLGSQRSHYRVDAIEEIIPDGTGRSLPLNADALVAATRPLSLAQWCAAGNCSGRVTIRFATPLRLRQKGKYLGEFDGPFFLETVARRLEALHVLFSGGALLADGTRNRLRELFASFQPEQVESRWHDLERYSNRQQRKVPLGGLVGTATAEVPETIGAWLAVASIINAGKGAAMGLGRVEAGVGALESGGPVARREALQGTRTGNVIRRERVGQGRELSGCSI